MKEEVKKRVDSLIKDLEGNFDIQPVGVGEILRYIFDELIKDDKVEKEVKRR